MRPRMSWPESLAVRDGPGSGLLRINETPGLHLTDAAPVSFLSYGYVWECCLIS